MLCSCGHHSPETPAQKYTQILSLFRNSHYAEARTQADQAAKQCSSDLGCQYKFRLLQAEILIQQQKDNDARALLAQPLPGGEFAALELRRRMLRGYLLFFNPATADAGRKLLDEAYQEAAQRGFHDLIPEMEIYEGKIARAYDASRARALFLKARQHAVEQHDQFQEAAALNNVGMMSVRNARYDEAIPFFEQELEPAKRVDAREIVTSAYTNLGVCYTQLGAYDRALELEKEGLAWLGTGDSPVVRGHLLGEMGRAYELKGELQKAIPYYRDALALSKEQKTDTWIAANNLASALAGIEDWNGAQKANQEELALAQLEKEEQPKAYAYVNAAIIAAGRKQLDEAVALYKKAISVKVDDPSILWESHAGLGRAYAASGDRPLARQHFEKALEIIDRNRTGLNRSEYQMSFLGSLIRFYQDYVEFLMQSGDSGKALEIVESSRARILAESFGPQRSGRWLGLPEIQQAARRSGTVFLSYWLAPRQSYVWLISPAGSQHFALGPASGIESAVDRCRESMPQWDLPTQERSEARRIRDMVIGPVAAAIPANARVVIVPDGALHYLNFETLPAGGEKPHYWIEDVTVAIAPSLAIAAAAPMPKPSRPKSLLIIGDAIYSGKDYNKLDYAPAEIRTVSSKFGSAKKTVVTGADANPMAYRQSNPLQFSIIHFSAHGEANPQSPLDSAIILSPKEGAFKLYARDVVEAPLRADLVTISVCRSAGARVYSGEGLVGFAWAFLRAGARYVVAGLWDVTDKSTPAMMDNFYGAIEKGKSPVDALRIAKLAMIHSEGSFRKPYYWGPFQIYVR